MSSCSCRSTGVRRWHVEEQPCYQAIVFVYLGMSQSYVHACLQPARAGVPDWTQLLSPEVFTADRSITDGRWAEPVTLSPAATFKLSFTVTDGSSGVVPQQAFIVFRDTRDADSAPVTLQLGVKPTGRTTYYMVSPPSSRADGRTLPRFPRRSRTLRAHSRRPSSSRTVPRATRPPSAPSPSPSLLSLRRSPPLPLAMASRLRPSPRSRTPSGRTRRRSPCSRLVSARSPSSRRG